MKGKIVLGWLLLLVSFTASSQTYSPIVVSGFTQDGFAETGTNAMMATSTGLDFQNHMMYTQSFAATNGLNGGIVNSGTIVNGNRTFQMADLSANNVLYLSLNGLVANSSATGTLTLTTPASYSNISIMWLSTEGNSTVNVVCTFTDGTTSSAGSFTILDWFFGANSIYAGFGRIVRIAAPPYNVDGYPNDPRFYAANISLGCTNSTKTLQSITFNYTGQTGNSGRAVIMAVSGIMHTPFATTATITPASCGASNGSIVLTATGGTAPLSYVWSTTPPQFSSTATGLAAGNYTATISDANGCTTTYQGTVNSSSAITATASATPSVICAGETATLMANSSSSNLTYTWSPGGQTGQTISVSPTDTTLYTVTAQDPNGCTATATVTLPVKKRPVASFMPSLLRLCLRNRDTVTFTGTAGSGAVYSWNFGATIISGTGAGPYIIQYSTPGTQTITLTVTENGCASTQATGTVITDAFSQPSFSAMPAAICSGDTIQVAFTGTVATGATPAWNWGGGTVISGSGLGPYVVKYTTSGTIQLVVNNNTCADTATVRNITVTPLPVASFTPSAVQGCTPSVLSFTNTSQNGLTYSWAFGDNSTSTDQTPAPHLYDQSGSYSVVLRAVNGNCSATSAPQIIRIIDPPMAGFTSTPDATATPLQISQAQFNFTNTSTGGTSYKWLFGDADSSTAANPLHRYTKAGSFMVMLIAYNALGCSDTFSKAPYIIIPDSSLRIPNAFSPNGDGINDRWVIPGLLGYPTALVEIFDRYGQLVFRSTGYDTPWDGRRNGKEVPIGTYYYVIRTSLRNYNGWVFIAR